MITSPEVQRLAKKYMGIDWSISAEYAWRQVDGKHCMLITASHSTLNGVILHCDFDCENITNESIFQLVLEPFAEFAKLELAKTGKEITAVFR